MAIVAMSGDWRLRIGVDIDGTVYPWTVAVNEALMQTFGIEDPGEHPSWNYLRDTLPQEEWRWVWSEEGAQAVFGRADLIWEGCAAVVNALAAEHDVHFVTHRNPRLLTAITGTWIAQHFHDYRAVHVCDSSVQKHKLLDWDVFIDDKHETVRDLLYRSDCRAVIMPNRPWNDGLLDDLGGSFSHLGFEHWKEVPGLIENRCH